MHQADSPCGHPAMQRWGCTAVLAPALSCSAPKTWGIGWWETNETTRRSWTPYLRDPASPRLFNGHACSQFTPHPLSRPILCLLIIATLHGTHAPLMHLVSSTGIPTLSSLHTDATIERRCSPTHVSRRRTHFTGSRAPLTMPYEKRAATSERSRHNAGGHGLRNKPLRVCELRSCRRSCF